jgi:hypothetical protein
MTTDSEQKYIDDLVSHSEETLVLLSNKEKTKRERMVVAAFLRCLGVTFSSNDIESPQDDPPDIIYKEACFEVRELLDEGRRRGDEYKDRHETLIKSTSIEDTLLPYDSPTPISYRKIFQLITAALSKKALRYGKQGCSDLITAALSKKALRYGKQGCSDLDALVCVNLQNRFLDPTTGITNFDSLMAQGWRSVSFVTPPYSHVIFAKDTAPDFLKSNTGEAKREWDDSDTFFELT